VPVFDCIPQVMQYKNKAVIAILQAPTALTLESPVLSNVPGLAGLTRSQRTYVRSRAPNKDPLLCREPKSGLSSL